jgi:hypothetical protein
MQRTWRLLLIVGILGLLSELVFMIFKLMIYGNQKEGSYAEIWFGLSITAILLSGLIAIILYGKPYLKMIRDWVDGA